MKTVFILLASIIVTAGYSQEIKLVNYSNLSNEKLTETYKYHKEVKIKITNIKQFIFKVSTEKTETDFHIKVPAMLSGITLPPFLTTRQIDIQTSFKGNTSAQGNNTLEEDYHTLIDIHKYLKGAIDMHNSVVHLSKNCDDNYTTIEKKVRSEIKTFLSDSSNNTIPALADELQKLILDTIALAEATYSHIENEAFGNWKVTLLEEYRATKTVTVKKW